MVYQVKEWDEAVVVHHIQHYLTCDLCGRCAIWESTQIPPINGWYTSKEGLHYCSSCDDKRVHGLQIMAEKELRKLGRPRKKKEGLK